MIYPYSRLAKFDTESY